MQNNEPMMNRFIDGRDLKGNVVRIDTSVAGWKDRHYGLSYQTFEGSNLKDYSGFKESKRGGYQQEAVGPTPVQTPPEEPKNTTPPVGDPVTPPAGDDDGTNGDDGTTADPELEDLRGVYKALHDGKDVPSNKKNDKEWMQAKNREKAEGK